MKRVATWLLLLSLGTLSWSGCERREPTVAGELSSLRPIGRSEKVYATWYNVPPNSLAQRRAGREELTAASDTLPLGTLLRVTRLTNQRSVVVRITDRGLHSQRSRLDVCRGAAEQLGMVRDGIAQVQVQVLAAPSAMPAGATKLQAGLLSHD